MTYDETLQFLYSQTPQFQQIGAAAYKPGLDTVSRLAALFGNKHKKLRCIHIGGTNGKGSTAHSIASVLQAAGYKVGLFTSPHLLDFRERIRVNGEKIPQHEVVAFVEACREKDALAGRPSFFELTTVMAFEWFARCEVDFAVIEVGLGGRLDSTNIITPILSVITNISFDHTAQLGNTLKAIAGEKAGIIKAGIPVVIGEAEGEVKCVFADTAASVGAPVRFACDEEIFARKPACVANGDREVLRAQVNGLGIVDYELTGDCQSRNLATILTAVDELRKQIQIPDDAVCRGLSSVVETTGLAGRWMTLSHDPLIVCDTGHNIGGWQWLAPRLDGYQGELIMIIGFVNDKDISHILPLMPWRGRYIFTRASVPRSLPASDLALEASRFGLNGEISDNVESAIDRATQMAAQYHNAMVFIGGSTFVVADALKALTDWNY